MGRRTKIICTLGPSADSQARVGELIDAGMDVARLNFSHGTHDEHAERMRWVRAAAEERGKSVAVLQDLCGPKIRTGEIGEPVPLALGEEVTLVEGQEACLPEIPIQQTAFGRSLEPGDRVLLDDGRIALRVSSSADGRGGVKCCVEVAGELRDRVGVHLPARSVSLASFTGKDREDLAFGLSLGVDFVAVSFVRAPGDMRLVRAFCEERGHQVPLVAKIETPPAVEDLHEILEFADAIMVARGDLGVEFAPEAVPVLQRRIISMSQLSRKPVIVATEMLQSMVHAKRPTRAEASDVAHAVFEGADAVMLSAETATGKHPTLAVQMMGRIIDEAERSVSEGNARPGTAPRESMAESIAFNAADIAEEVGAAALVAFTASGTTARLTACARPDVPLFAFCPAPEISRHLALLWGVRPFIAPRVEQTDAMLQLANDTLIQRGFVDPGDRFVVVFGAPVGSGAETNSISVKVAG